MRAFRFSAFAVFLLIPLACLAVPTGLNFMPTADTLSCGLDRVEYESSGSGKFYVPQGGALYGTQTGLPFGLEAGVDNATDNSTVYNLKWRFMGNFLFLPALAVGVQNAKIGNEPESYVVATKSLLPHGMLKVSAGLMHITDGTVNSFEGQGLPIMIGGRWFSAETLTMLGAQSTLGPIILKADTATGGMLARSAVSAGYTLAGFTVTGTLYHFKDAPNETTVLLSYSNNIF